MNVAVGASPSAHSKWAWQENAGVDAVVDGTIDNKCGAALSPAMLSMLTITYSTHSTYATYATASLYAYLLTVFTTLTHSQ